MSECVKEELEKQVLLLSERSKDADVETLLSITRAMCEAARLLAGDGTVTLGPGAEIRL